jgi:hypothetical protein
MNSTLKCITARGFFWAACIVSLAMLLCTASPAVAVPTVPVLWTAGGHSAGTDSAGQAARIATDASGNVAVVSGPSLARDLAVTSYTASGFFRWRGAVSPSSGTFRGDWVAAAPNGDFVAVGHNVTASGNPIAITLVRFGSDGTLQWRVDLARTLPSVGRLLVDSGGNAYLDFNSVGDGQDIQLHKYSPSAALLWSQVINTGFFSNNIATSLALSADETDVVLTGDTIGGAEWITALYDTSTGVRQWLVTAPEGTAARDVVIDADRVYVTGQGNVGISAFLTVVAYDRATGARLWRTDKRPAGSGGAAGLRMAMAPDGSLVVTGQASLGFLDWYTVAFETNGTARWEAVRDGGLNTDEIPAGLLVLPDGTTVVTGRGGPTLPGGFWPGVTAGYSAAGTLLWEAFSLLATVWATALPNGDVCATGGYDAYLACWGVSDGVVNPPQPTSVVSRKTHGTAGAFDINLPLAGNAGVECRSGGASGDHQVVFTFLTAVTLSGSSVTPEAGKSGRMAGPPSISPDGRTVTLNLTDVTDVQTITLALLDVNNGTSTNDVNVLMRLLVGDTNANGMVNASDVSQTKSQSGQAVTNSNFRTDVTVNGTINASDLALVKSRSGQ